VEIAPDGKLARLRDKRAVILPCGFVGHCVLFLF
jgi:hypothetical protein